MAEQTTIDRLAVLVAALLPGQVPAREEAALLRLLTSEYEEPTNDRVWLALCVLKAEFPTSSQVLETARQFKLEGPAKVLRRLVRTPARLGLRSGFKARPVRVVTGMTVVDVHHTARTGLATGIQRVVRRTIQHWLTSHELVLVGWDSSFAALRELSAVERENAVHGTSPEADPSRSGEMTIPWRSTYILPELAIEPERTSRIQALAEFSGNATYAIGYDCVPLTSAETTGIGMGGAFAKNLAALARFDRIATISAAAAVEYRGWRRMLSGAGLTGPDIAPILLAADAGTVSDAQLASARERLIVDDLPLLFCVGSHEPRKNHLAVLNAAEILWRKGHKFSLSFVGGNSWGSRAFSAQLEQLQELGRPVQSISAISDDLLWGGYHLAKSTVFPSLNEGFGLPVAESLAAGTPVVTSAFGSMMEICDQGGGILIDPRDDDDLAAGLESALFDDLVNERLRAEAKRRTNKGWHDYAAEVWSYFHGDPYDLPSGQMSLSAELND